MRLIYFTDIKITTVNNNIQIIKKIKLLTRKDVIQKISKILFNVKIKYTFQYIW